MIFIYAIKSNPIEFDGMEFNPLECLSCPSITFASVFPSKFVCIGQHMSIYMCIYICIYVYLYLYTCVFVCVAGVGTLGVGFSVPAGFYLRRAACTRASNPPLHITLTHS